MRQEGLASMPSAKMDGTPAPNSPPQSRLRELTRPPNLQAAGLQLATGDALFTGEFALPPPTTAAPATAKPAAPPSPAPQPAAPPADVKAEPGGGGGEPKAEEKTGGGAASSGKRDHKRKARGDDSAAEAGGTTGGSKRARSKRH